MVIPSLFATDDLGERFTPYSLGSQTIPPFLAPQMTRTSSLNHAWTPIDSLMIEELGRRSAKRLEENEDFAKIDEQLAKLAEQDDVVHLAEWIKEREGEDRESSTSATSDAKEDEATSGKKTSETGTAEARGTHSAATTSTGEVSTAQATGSGEAQGESAEDEESKPSPQREEAVRILADLVELQETARSSWHVPQSASRSESSSSVP